MPSGPRRTRQSRPTRPPTAMQQRRSRSLDGQLALQESDRVPDGREPELAEQSLESPGRAFEPPVVRHTGGPRNRETRLARVKFPRMDVEGSRNAPALALLKGGTGHDIRKETEVGPASRWQVHPAPAERARRHLRDPADRTLEPVIVGAPACVTVPRSPNGKKARVVAMPFLDEDVERPLPTTHNRKARRPIAEHHDARQVLQQALGASHRVPKLQRAELRERRMVPAVRRDLMARTRDPLHHLGMSLPNPAEDEEGSSGLVAGEQVQHARNTVLYPGYETVPIRPAHVGRERRDLEVLLDVDSEMMRHHRWRRVQRSCPPIAPTKSKNRRVAWENRVACRASTLGCCGGATAPARFRARGE